MLEVRQNYDSLFISNYKMHETKHIKTSAILIMVKKIDKSIFRYKNYCEQCLACKTLHLVNKIFYLDKSVTSVQSLVWVFPNE